MSDFFPGVFVGALLGGLAVIAVSCTHWSDLEERRRLHRGSQACGSPGALVLADRGVALCRDGRAFRWSEGYLRRVGRE